MFNLQSNLNFNIRKASMKTDGPYNHFSTQDDMPEYDDTGSMFPDIIITKRSEFEEPLHKDEKKVLEI